MSAPTPAPVGTWAVRDAKDRDDSPTRARLLRAAEVAFAAQGFARTTVADITTGAGTGRATFYVYFSSRTEIFGALAAEVRERLCAAQDVTASGTPTEVWNAALAAYLDAWTGSIALLRVISHQALVDPEMRRVLDEIRAVPTRRHRRFVERLERDGFARPAASPELTAQAVQGMVERYADLVAAGTLTRDDAIAALSALYSGMVRFTTQ
ncbi:MAG: TetR/AcrR family transcriptional regulator [Pseudonocardia sp.]|nr:TetR/AcrR family transcriptional regulator [Pseudonocardia sp.]